MTLARLALAAAIALSPGVAAHAQQLLPAPGGLRSPGFVTSEASAKLVSRLRALIADFRHEGFGERSGGGDRRASQRFSSTVLKVDPAARVHVYVTVTDTEPGTLAALARHGFHPEIVNRHFGVVQGWAPIERLEALAGEPAVVRIRPPSYAAPSAPPEAEGALVTTPGDAIHRCAEARAAGFTGAGVKVGVVSNGVDGLAASQAAGELPAVEVLHAGLLDEGTAMLEIVHDCAPNAGLAFHSAVGPGNAITSLSFIQALDALRDAGAHVIVDDLQNFPGEPYFEDGMAALHDRGLGAAVLRISAASNGGQMHYQGLFKAGPPLTPWTLHDFGGGDTRLRFRAASPGGLPFGFVLQWDNRFGAAADNYDLFVREVSGAVAASSQLIQDGNDDPIEFVVMVCGGPPGTVCVGDVEIRRRSGAAVALEMFCIGTCQFDQFNTRQDSVFGHAAVPEVLAVAAAGAGSPDVVQPYSSAGPVTISAPRRELRFKPDLTGVDCVPTSRPGFNPFCGTSAGAPHVAGVAALLLEAMGPGTPPALTRSRLKATAVDLGTAGPDWDFGFGRADAMAAISPPAVNLALASSALPISRVGQVGTTVSVFAALIAAGDGIAKGCTVVPGVPLNALFTFFRTDPATNQPVGQANTPFDLPAGQAQTLVLLFAISAPFPPTEVPLVVECLNAAAAAVISGLSTVFLSGSSGPVQDVVALAATGPPNNGIVDLQGPNGAGTFAMATVNVGTAGGKVTVTGDTGNATLPVAIAVCQTDPATGLCLGPASGEVSATIEPGQTPTFAFFIASLGVTRPFDAATDRVFGRIRDAVGQIIGATSVALRWLP